MPTISNAALSVTTSRPKDQATVIVSSEVQFTEVEVNAMNPLSLRYTLHCKILNKDMLDEEPVLSYHHQSFPTAAGEARRHEHAVFEDTVWMETLHERLIGKDTLLAQLKLKNEETGEEIKERTEVVELDLAA